MLKFSVPVHGSWRVAAMAERYCCSSWSMNIMIVGVGERLSGGLKDVKGNSERKLWKKRTK